MVVVRLMPELQFTSQKLLEKIRGARLQEVQFFPDEHEAVLLFVYPQEAEAFIKHIEYARGISDHEFRRLQLAATWYKTISLDAIYPTQPGVLAQILSHGASRAIKVDGISNDVHIGMLEAFLKSHFEHMVGLRLIRPTKNYEKNRENSTFMLIDFDSRAMLTS